MAVANRPVPLGTPAPAFRLPGTDGRTYSLDDIAGENGTVVAFICNHCPYVIASARRMVEDARALKEHGVGFVAICANDAARSPADSFERMREFAREHDFPFPYLHDESQEIAATYGAQVTPDFFGCDADGRLAYRGRLDAGTAGAPPAGARRDLLEAMTAVAAGRPAAAPADPPPSQGCTIKWR
jgi:peroxiredoxin